MKHEPANTIIKFLGGASAVANILSMHKSWIYRWVQPTQKKGTGGLIPAKHQNALLNYCEKNGIDLRPDDFFKSERLQRLLDTVESSPQ